jgi:hypothetical protein
VATAFSRQEQLMFDKMVEGFDDALVIAKAATIDTTLMNAEAAERSAIASGSRRP